MAQPTPLDELNEALHAHSLAEVQRLHASSPEVFQEPRLRHTINAHPHNRGTAHAIALENVFMALRVVKSMEGSAESIEVLEQSVSICRFLLSVRAPLVLGHDFHVVAPDESYATLLFVQQPWLDEQVELLGALFDEYVSAGHIQVDRTFPRTNAAFGLQLPLDAALAQRNHHAVRALFRAGVSTSCLGVRPHSKALGVQEAARLADDSTDETVALAMKAMLQGQVEEAERSRPAVVTSAPAAADLRRRRAHL